MSTLHVGAFLPRYISPDERETARKTEFQSLHKQSMHKWRKLAVCPDKRYAIPMAINKRTLIVPALDALLKYDIVDNKWSEHYKYPLDAMHDHSARSHRNQFLHFDAKRKLLYILSAQRVDQTPNLLQIDMTRNAVHVLSALLAHHHRPIHAVTLMIENTLHLLLQSRFRHRWQHIVWNKKKEANRLSEIKEFERSDSSSSYAAFVYVRSRQLVVLLDVNVGLFTYSLHAQQPQWAKVENFEFMQQLKEEQNLTKIGQFAYVLSKDDRFLVLFTGFIWIIDLIQMTMRKSSVVCPISTGYFHAVLVDEEVTDQWLCDGYVRECWTEREMQHLVCLPVYLVRLIQSFYSDQIVHLFENYRQIGHWRIKLNDILSS